MMCTVNSTLTKFFFHPSLLCSDQITIYVRYVHAERERRLSSQYAANAICIQDISKRAESEFDKMEIFLCSFCASFSTSLCRTRVFPKGMGYEERLCRMFDGRPKRGRRTDGDGGVRGEGVGAKNGWN